MSIIAATRQSGASMSISDLMLNRPIMQLCATVCSMLHYIMFDETRRGVFKTKMCLEMFQAAVVELNPVALKDFHIDEWYGKIVAPYVNDKSFEISPSKFSQTIDINWMLPLLTYEREYPGFIMLLHNTLEFEDSMHSKVAEKSKKEDEYDFQGLGVRNKATQLLLEHQQVHRACLTGGSKR